LAFESDDDDRRPVDSAASKSDPSELGKLAAELPASERRSSAPPGPDSDENIDAAALAALSKGRGARTPRDSDDGRVKLQGAAVGPASVPPASAAPAPRSGYGWLIGLAIGFAVGVPVGGVLFPRTTVVSIPATPKSSVTTEAQLAAEARARAADRIAAEVHPLPIQRMAEQAKPAAAEAPAAEEPAAHAEPAAQAPPAPEEPAAQGSQTGSQPPAAVSAAPGPSKKLAAPDAHAREVGRAATAALNAAAPAAAPAAPQPAAAAPAPAPAATAQPASAQPAAAQVGPDGRSVDDLLDQALASSTARKEQERAERALAAESQANAIPLSPSRDDVTRAMTVLLPAIRGCAAGQSGLATVGIVVKNDGHVESASVSGAPFEGARSGRCMEGVVRRAKFPRFQQSSFRIQFPFAIQ
jgi:hypothetical protein